MRSGSNPIQWEWISRQHLWWSSPPDISPVPPVPNFPVWCWYLKFFKLFDRINPLHILFFGYPIRRDPKLFAMSAVFHTLSRAQLTSDSLDMNNKAFGLASFGGAAGRGYSPTAVYRHNMNADQMRRQMPGVSQKYRAVKTLLKLIDFNAARIDTTEHIVWPSHTARLRPPNQEPAATFVKYLHLPFQDTNRPAR